MDDAATCAVSLTQPYTHAVAQMQLQLEKGRAGLLIRYDQESRKGFAVLFDCKRNEIEFVNVVPRFLTRAIGLDTCERHDAHASDPASVTMKVIAEKNHILVFIDDVLRATYSFPCEKAGAFGVMAENATGTVETQTWYTT